MDVPDLPIFIVLCGKTGSGKTQVLRQFELCGYPVIDLEKIASHRGSAFGGLLLDSQPSQQHFNNEIEKSFSKFNRSAYIFIENKSVSLGKRKIPDWVYKKMGQGIFIFLDVEKKTRISNILHKYKDVGKDGFMNSLYKLKKRLSANVMNKCEIFLNAENYEAFIENILTYYDQTDKYALKNTNIQIKVKSDHTLEIMNQILKQLKESGISI